MNTDSYQVNSNGVSKKNTFNYILQCTLVFVLVVSVWFSEAFVIFILWSWFIVPLGVPSITYVHAIGLYLLWSFVKIPNYKSQRHEELTGLEYWKGYVAYSYFVIIVFLALAWPIYEILKRY